MSAVSNVPSLSSFATAEAHAYVSNKNTPCEQAIDTFLEEVRQVEDERRARAVFRSGFDRLRAELSLYPPSGSPAEVFESAAHTARMLAQQCLPLAIGISMHLYPLCALQCAPLPVISLARLQRASLMKTVRSASLILANAGSERRIQEQRCLAAERVTGGVRLRGQCEYMSLSSVAHVVFIRAELIHERRSVLCAADLRSPEVSIGSWKFEGNMRMSDTSAVTFMDQVVADNRCFVLPADGTLQYMSDYQRCWFHLFLAEIYMARIERLHRDWPLHRSREFVVSRAEMMHARAHALRLLDDLAELADCSTLTRATAVMKLRVSLMAQATGAALLDLQGSMPHAVERLREAARELSYIQYQPTADEKILRDLGVFGGVFGSTASAH